MANDDDDDRYNNEKREKSVRHVKMAVAKNKPNSQSHLPPSLSAAIGCNPNHINRGKRKKKEERSLGFLDGNKQTWAVGCGWLLAGRSSETAAAMWTSAVAHTL